MGFGVDILKGLTMGTYLFGRFGDGDVPFWHVLGWERTFLSGFRWGRTFFVGFRVDLLVGLKMGMYLFGRFRGGDIPFGGLKGGDLHLMVGFEVGTYLFGGLWGGDFWEPLVAGLHVE